jgi:transposase
MQPFPAERSVLVLDNCRIHHNEAIAELVQTAGMLQYPSLLTKLNIYSGCLILYLPAYSPDLNLIEESFSARKLSF